MSVNEQVKETAAVPNGETGEEEKLDATNGTKIDGTQTAPPKEDSVEQAEEQTAEDIEEFESAPDDLNDFIVLDEAEITDEENEEEEEEEHKIDDEEDGKQWDCPVHRLAPRTYKWSELEPSELDPRCKPDFPLAKYWPVYVGNFCLPKRNSDYNCMFAVHKYFASKGLPAFMVFRLKDSFFENYQKRVGLYDMLVYFINKKDANRAINWCHRDLYWGHRLKVYCGRTPAQIVSRTKTNIFKIKHLKAEDKLETETNLENYMRRYGEVVFLCKHSLDNVIVQLTNNPKRSASITRDPRHEATLFLESVRKQRFVEDDVIDLLTKEIAENPKFIRSRLRFGYLKFIMHGVIPEMYPSWADKDLKNVHKNVQSHPVPRHHPMDVPPYKRKYNDSYGNGAPSQPKSRRQLVREARVLEEQLRAVQSKIKWKSSQPKQTFQPKMQNANFDVMKPKRQKSEAALIRQRVRGARRQRVPKFDDTTPEVNDTI